MALRYDLGCSPFPAWNPQPFDLGLDLGFDLGCYFSTRRNVQAGGPTQGLDCARAYSSS